MKSRVAPLLLASTFVALAFVSSPVFAQGRPGGPLPGAGGVQTLASDLAALAARVAKLEGNIVAADLAGTYSAVILSTSLHGARPNVAPAAIETEGTPAAWFASTMMRGLDRYRAMQHLDKSAPQVDLSH